MYLNSVQQMVSGELAGECLQTGFERHGLPPQRAPLDTVYPLREHVNNVQRMASRGYREGLFPDTVCWTRLRNTWKGHTCKGHRKNVLKVMSFRVFFVGYNFLFVFFLGVFGVSVTRPKYPPYRKAPVALPLSHCVFCGIADYRFYTPTAFRRGGQLQSKDRPWGGYRRTSLSLRPIAP